MKISQNTIILKIKIYPEWFLYLFIIFGLVFWIPAAIVFLISPFSEGIFVSVLIIICFLYFTIRIAFSEILFYEEYIQYRSAFSKYSIKWSDIQSYGIFYRSTFSQRIVPFDEANKPVAFGIQYLFLSKDKNFNPSFMFPKVISSMSSETLYFIYRPEASSLIQEKLNRSKAK